MRTKQLLLFLNAAMVIAICPALSGDNPPKLVLEKVLGDARFRHAGSLIDVLPLPDGERVLTSGDDGSVRLWEIASGKELRRYVHQSGSYVWDICLMPDGKSFISAAYSGKVRKWDIESGDSEVLYTSERSVFRADMSPDGKLLAIAESKRCTLWDIERSEETGTIETDDNEDAYSVAFLDKGKRVMAGFDDAGAYIKNVEDMSTAFEIPRDSDGVYSILPSPDGSLLLACTSKKGLICLNGTTYATMWSALAGNSSIYSACWSPDQKLVAVSYRSDNAGDRSYAVSLIDPVSGRIALTRPVHRSNNHYGCAFTTDGKHLLVASGNTLCKFEVETGRRLFPEGQDDSFQNDSRGWIAYSPDLGRILTSSQGGGLLMLTTDAGKPAGMWQEDITFSHRHISQDGSLVAGTSDRRIFVVDIKSSKTVSLIDSTDYARSLLFANSGSNLIVEAYDKLNVFALPSGRLARTIPIGRSGSGADTISSQAKGPLAAVLAGQLIRVFHTSSGEMIGSMSVPEKLYATAFFPADGSSLIAAAGTNLYLWAESSTTEAASERAIRKAVSNLGARKFRDRQEASEFLIAQGTKALPFLDAADISDPEVRDRMKHIRGQVVSAQIYGQSTHTLSMQNTQIAGLYCHPSRPYWLGVSKHPSRSSILIGDVCEGKIRILNEIEDTNGPELLSFANEDTFYASNRNGTIGVYRIREK